jgi:group I intron endonuclease
MRKKVFKIPRKSANKICYFCNEVINNNSVKCNSKYYHTECIDEVKANIKSGVYKVTNVWNNKIYIGESLNIERRWKEHIDDLKNNKHHSYKLQNDWNIYGDKAFDFKIIKEINKQYNDLSKKAVSIIYEKQYIEKYNSINNGYNLENTYNEVISLNKKVSFLEPKRFRSLIYAIEKNMNKNNNEYIPVKSIKKKKIDVCKDACENDKSQEIKIINNINIKGMSIEEYLNKDNIKYIMSLSKAYEFESEYIRLSQIFCDIGFNSKKVFKILREINVIDEQNFLINPNKNYKCEEHVNFTTNDKMNTIFANRQGFKEICTIILNRIYKTKENIFYKRFFEKQNIKII